MILQQLLEALDFNPSCSMSYQQPLILTMLCYRISEQVQTFYESLCLDVHTGNLILASDLREEVMSFWWRDCAYRSVLSVAFHFCYGNTA